MDANSGRFHEKGKPNPFSRCIVSKKCGKDGVGKWQRSLPMTPEEAVEGARNFTAMWPFSTAFVADYKQSVTIGLPV